MFATSSSSSTSSTIWTYWSGTSVTTTPVDTWYSWTNATSTASNTSIWVDWVSCHPTNAFDRERIVESAADIAAREARIAAYREQESARRREEEAAIERAEQLLLSVLSAEQRAQLERDKSFVVQGKHARYRINRGRTGNVDVIGRDGRIMHRLCAHPEILVPNADTMVAQKLMLESSEEEFLRIANRHTWNIPQAPVLPPLPAPARMQ